MEEKNEMETIDLRVIFSKIWAKKKIYYIVLPIVFILSCAYILCIPRTYTSSLSLAPEMNNSSNIGGTIGSLAMIKAMAAPYTNVKFMPTGGINAKNLEEYLSFGKIAACGGSWMVKADLVDNKEYDKIAEMTKEAVELVKKIRG